jgi:hypothetical protein
MSVNEERERSKMAGLTCNSYKRKITRTVGDLSTALLTLYAFSWTVAEAKEPVPVAREPYFGRHGIDCLVPKTDPDPGAPANIPAKPSIPPASYNDLVEKFILAAKDGNSDAFLDILKSRYYRSKHAGSCIRETQSLAEHCTREPPYLLGDLEVRVTWDCRRQLPYNEFFTISKGRISTIYSLDETTPPVFLRRQ